MKHVKILVVVFLATALLLAACAQGEIALQVTGSVAKETGWTEAQVQKMDAIDVEYTEKDESVSVYSGVLIMDLLEEAGINDGATTIVFVADDGYTAEVTLEELSACSNCIVASQDDGGFRTVMPDFSGKLQVKGVIEIQVQ